MRTSRRALCVAVGKSVAPGARRVPVRASVVPPGSSVARVSAFGPAAATQLLSSIKRSSCSTTLPSSAASVECAAQGSGSVPPQAIHATAEAVRSSPSVTGGGNDLNRNRNTGQSEVPTTPKVEVSMTLLDGEHGVVGVQRDSPRAIEKGLSVVALLLRRQADDTPQRFIVRLQRAVSRRIIAPTKLTLTRRGDVDDSKRDTSTEDSAGTRLLRGVLPSEMHAAALAAQRRGFYLVFIVVAGMPLAGGGANSAASFARDFPHVFRMLSLDVPCITDHPHVNITTSAGAPSRRSWSADTPSGSSGARCRCDCLIPICNTKVEALHRSLPKAPREFESGRRALRDGLAAFFEVGETRSPLPSVAAASILPTGEGGDALARREFDVGDAALSRLIDAAVLPYLEGGRRHLPHPVPLSLLHAELGWAAVEGHLGSVTQVVDTFRMMRFGGDVVFPLTSAYAVKTLVPLMELYDVEHGCVGRADVDEGKAQRRTSSTMPHAVRVVDFFEWTWSRFIAPKGERSGGCSGTAARRIAALTKPEFRYHEGTLLRCMMHFPSYFVVDVMHATVALRNGPP